ncbi:hypothetical protein X741_28105 [Mesorhizobium sp. LNHC229A00]|nr:hypothetical protein X741_28105 [Mesorhizobium sp. LNHC229A00]
MDRSGQLILPQEGIAGSGLLPAEGLPHIRLAGQPEGKTIIRWHIGPAFDEGGEVQGGEVEIPSGDRRREKHQRHQPFP